MTNGPYFLCVQTYTTIIVAAYRVDQVNTKQLKMAISSKMIKEKGKEKNKFW